LKFLDSSKDKPGLELSVFGSGLGLDLNRKDYILVVEDNKGNITKTPLRDYAK
jgi:hypothetical protein